jgi:hypothetical protein
VRTSWAAVGCPRTTCRDELRKRLRGPTSYIASHRLVHASRRSVCSHDLRGGGPGRSVHTCRRVGWLFFGLRPGHRRRGEWLERGLLRPKSVCRLLEPAVGRRGGGWVSGREVSVGPVVIAVDPHKRSWTAVVVNGSLQLQNSVRVEADGEGCRELRRFGGVAAGAVGDRGCGRVGCAVGDPAARWWVSRCWTCRPSSRLGCGCCRPGMGARATRPTRCRLRWRHGGDCGGLVIMAAEVHEAQRPCSSCTPRWSVCQHAVQPPSTGRTVPVTYPASSESK